MHTYSFLCIYCYPKKQQKNKGLNKFRRPLAVFFFVNFCIFEKVLTRSFNNQGITEAYYVPAV